MKELYVHIPGAPKAVGPYAPAVRAGSYTFLSGQIPINPETGEICGPTIEAQTEQVMKNIRAVLMHIGRDFTDIVKTTIFLTDMGQFQIVNGIYAQWMKEHKPARSTVQVSALPLKALIEIECIVSNE